MDLHPRLLAFLEYEMKQIKEDRSRDNEDREHASAILGRVEAEIQGNKDLHAEADVEAVNLFS